MNTKQNPFIISKEYFTALHKAGIIQDGTLRKALAGETVFIFEHRAYFKTNLPNKNICIFVYGAGGMGGEFGVDSSGQVVTPERVRELKQKSEELSQARFDRKLEIIGIIVTLIIGFTLGIHMAKGFGII